MKNKAIRPSTVLLQSEYDFVFAKPVSTDCYELSKQSVAALFTVLDYLGWKTRWYSESGQPLDADRIEALANEIRYSLMSPVECGGSIVQMSCKPISEVFFLMSDTAPAGSLPMIGGTFLQSAYPLLVPHLPSSWLSGQNFVLPNMASRTLVGAGFQYLNSGGIPLWADAGSLGGEIEHTLLVGEMAQHSHTISPNGEDMYLHNIAGFGSGGATHSAGTTKYDVQASTGNKGSNLPHNNMSPFNAGFFYIQADACEDNGTVQFRFDGCVLQYSTNGEAWQDVSGWITNAGNCFVGPAGPAGETGPAGPAGPVGEDYDVQKYRCQTSRGLAHGLIEKIESYLEPLAYSVTTLAEFSAHVLAQWELEFDEPPTNQIETFIAYCWGQADRQAFYLQFSAYNFEADLAQYVYTVSTEGDFCGNEMNNFVLLAACQGAIPEIMAVSYFVDAAKYLSYDGVRYWFRDVYRMRDWGYCDECGSIEELEMCIYSFPVCWDFTLGRGDWEFYWADSGGCTNPYTDEATGIVARWDECSEFVSLGARLQLGGADVTSLSFTHQTASVGIKTIRFHAFVGSTWVQFYSDSYLDTTERTHSASAPVGASALNVTISVEDITAEITAKSVSISGTGSANWAGNGCS